jgi:hypothetical protein
MKYKINIYQLNLILLFVGYFLINCLSNIFLEYEYIISSSYRYFQLTIAILAIIHRFPYFIQNLKGLPSLLFIFIVLYTIRLLYDYLTLNEIEDGLKHLYQFDFISVIPAFALITLKREDLLNMDVIFKFTLALAVLLSIPFFKADLVLSGRQSLTENFNSLYLGQFAVSLSIFSFYHLYSQQKFKILNIVLFILGIIVMGMAGSRSPLVSLILMIILFTVNTKGKIKILSILLTISLFGYFMFGYFEVFLQKIGSSFIDRIAQVLHEKDSSGRDIRLLASFQQFLTNPITGTAHYIQNRDSFGKYPHNLILESFMSVGILGGINFIIILAKTIRSGYKLLSEKTKGYDFGWIFLIFIQFLCFGFFSGSIYGSYYFWGFLFLCLHTKNIQYQRLRTI